MLYAACLKAAGKLYSLPELKEKAERVESYLRKNAFDGRFFVDNLVRNQAGELEQSGLLTEVCQYYAFWLGFVSKEQYPDLYEELMEHLGTNREKDYLPEMGKPNVMYGQYMRIDLLMRDGKREQVLKECRKLIIKLLFLIRSRKLFNNWESFGVLYIFSNIFSKCSFTKTRKTIFQIISIIFVYIILSE